MEASGYDSVDIGDYAKPDVTQMQTKKAANCTAPIAFSGGSVTAQVSEWRSVRRLTISVLAFTFFAGGVSAQGLRPLDQASYDRAIQDGTKGHGETNHPLRIRFTVLRDSRALDIYREVPFQFFIDTPYSYVRGKVAFDTAKFRAVTPPTLLDANARLIAVQVSPGLTFTTADAIETVVIKRGDQVIRPVQTRVMKSRVTNALGAGRDLTEGSFHFPFDAFAPGHALTLVLVGSRGNFEWVMSEAEIAAIR